MAETDQLAGENSKIPVAEVKPTVMPQEPEPQNALTQKFTEPEWDALRSLRDALPLVISEAALGSGPVRIWGVELNPNGVKEARESVVLMKFLRARNLNVEAAATMLTATLRWRAQFKVDEALEEKFPEELFGKLGRVYGRDKGGRPVTYNLYGGDQDLKAIFSDIPRFLRWRVALMERGVLLLDFENVDQMVQVHDYEGVGMSSRTPESKSAAAEATNLFQSHYPELLHKKFFVNVPTIMTWVFWAFKPLMSAQTVAKMAVVGSGPEKIGKDLLPVIDADELPQRYGGHSEAF